MRNVLIATFILLLLPQISFSKERLRSISVNGNSTTTVDAQYAKIVAQLKVVTPSIEESYEAATHQLSELAKTLQNHGVTKEDLTVSIISQGGEYEWSNNSQTLAGYYSACSLQIKINNIGDTYSIHRELAKYPSLSTGHTEYGRNDVSQLRTAALQEALKVAKVKARVMAETLGAELGQVLNIRESGSVPIPVGGFEARLAANPTDPGEVSATGSVTITGDVSVDFEIK